MAEYRTNSRFVGYRFGSDGSVHSCRSKRATISRIIGGRSWKHAAGAVK